jgi:hypothetical protein
VGIGAELVVVGTSVLMVPLLVNVPDPDKVYAAVISNVPPAVVVKVAALVTIKLPPAVSVPLVLLKVKL